MSKSACGLSHISFYGLFAENKKGTGTSFLAIFL